MAAVRTAANAVARRERSIRISNLCVRWISANLHPVRVPPWRKAGSASRRMSHVHMFCRTQLPPPEWEWIIGRFHRVLIPNDDVFTVMPVGALTGGHGEEDERHEFASGFMRAHHPDAL